MGRRSNGVVCVVPWRRLLRSKFVEGSFETSYLGLCSGCRRSFSLDTRPERGYHIVPLRTRGLECRALDLSFESFSLLLVALLIASPQGLGLDLVVPAELLAHYQGVLGILELRVQMANLELQFLEGFSFGLD